MSVVATGSVSYLGGGSAKGLSDTLAGKVMFGGSDFRPNIIDATLYGKTLSEIPLFAGYD